MAATGPAQFGEWLSGRLAYKSFDNLIKTAELQITHHFQRYAREYRNGDAASCVVLAGWHEKEDRPAIYSIELETAGTPKALLVRQSAEFEEKHVAASLTELPIISMPPPSLEEFQAADYDLIADLEKVDPESYLLHCMEIQRRKRFDGRHVVGGHAVLTTITASGVVQRLVHVWPEDQPGSRIEPVPIDWSAWRAERAAARSAQDRVARAGRG
ncbi:hypothetical protein IVB15_32970 [Bradyrhizobium sp. 182]|uniref:hypothetical protein n=1 Tax=unclassified Bradyrhizobium TaxID=2631580 RepID=UPI001FFB18FE|nr:MULTISPECIES: hypothetical protein [unclassified Bradyrhizobium]MCK1420723.1 hypothetical protein [Bradyrhizobium sp. CW12]MCK1532382.1 hypothetical protein [Bradyrhizobium sp. 182]MCK1595654.1 hypothetical protein [Bradyrhizobium sp. 164]MCK1647320.1 hypothetical protein [Bradyrhizobium sp. 154]